MLLMDGVDAPSQVSADVGQGPQDVKDIIQCIVELVPAHVAPHTAPRPTTTG